MGKRARRRSKAGGSPAAPNGPSSFADLGIDLELEAPEASGEAEVVLEGDHGTLTVRTSMSPGTRAEYAALMKGERSSTAAAREDTWHRAMEFLYERLVVRWDIAGVETTGQRLLLERLRVTTPAERDAVRQALRAHLAAHFPDIEAP